MVEEGHFKGGVAAYGYELVKSGRFNKRKHELYDLKINQKEAFVVKLIFDKYTEEGYGAHRITTWLNNNGYREAVLEGICRSDLLEYKERYTITFEPNALWLIEELYWV